MQIIRLINQIKSEAGALSATKSAGVPFPFRGIDGTINHLSKHLIDAGIVTVPTVVEYESAQREDAKGKVVTSAKMLVDFTFYAPDGSNVTARTAGYADDYADRAAAQAQSVAFRVALLQTFTLPTQSPEPEQTGQDVQDGTTNTHPAQRRVAEKPKTTVKQPAKKADTGDTAALKAKVRDAIAAAPEESRDEFRLHVNEQWATISDKMKKPKGDAAVLEALLKNLETGEVA